MFFKCDPGDDFELFSAIMIQILATVLAQDVAASNGSGKQRKMVHWALRLIYVS